MRQGDDKRHFYESSTNIGLDTKFPNQNACAKCSPMKSDYGKVRNDGRFIDWAVAISRRGLKYV